MNETILIERGVIRGKHNKFYNVVCGKRVPVDRGWRKRVTLGLGGSFTCPDIHRGCSGGHSITPINGHAECISCGSTFRVVEGD